MEDKEPSIPNSCSAANCGTRYLCDKAVLEAKTASTPNLEDQLSTDPTDFVSNSHFPGTKSRFVTSQLLPNLLKYSIEPPSAERGLYDYIQVDQPIFIKWLHSGSTKTWLTGHRRDRQPRTSGERSWQKVLLSLYRGRRRRRVRPPRSVLLLPWLHRPKGQRRGRSPSNYPSFETDLVPIFFSIGFPDTSCFLHVLLLSNTNAYPQPELYSIFFQGGKKCPQSSTYHFAILCWAFKSVYSSLSLCGKECSTIRARGVD